MKKQGTTEASTLHLQQPSLTDVRGEKHHVEGGHEVVDPLHVAARWVSNGPYVQYPLHRSLDLRQQGVGADREGNIRTNKTRQTTQHTRHFTAGGISTAYTTYNEHKRGSAKGNGIATVQQRTSSGRYKLLNGLFKLVQKRAGP